MQAYEYTVIQTDSGLHWRASVGTETERLNILGVQGWELVGVDSDEKITRMYLKRPKVNQHGERSPDGAHYWDANANEWKAV